MIVYSDSSPAAFYGLADRVGSDALSLFTAFGQDQSLNVVLYHVPEPADVKMYCTCSFRLLDEEKMNASVFRRPGFIRTQQYGVRESSTRRPCAISNHGESSQRRKSEHPERDDRRNRLEEGSSINLD